MRLLHVISTGQWVHLFHFHQFYFGLCFGQRDPHIMRHIGSVPEFCFDCEQCRKSSVHS